MYDIKQLHEPSMTIAQNSNDKGKAFLPTVNLRNIEFDLSKLTQEQFRSLLLRSCKVLFAVDHKRKFNADLAGHLETGRKTRHLVDMSKVMSESTATVKTDERSTFIQALMMPGVSETSIMNLFNALSSENQAMFRLLQAPRLVAILAKFDTGVKLENHDDPPEEPESETNGDEDSESDEDPESKPE